MVIIDMIFKTTRLYHIYDENAHTIKTILHIEMAKGKNPTRIVHLDISNYSATSDGRLECRIPMGLMTMASALELFSSKLISHFLPSITMKYSFQI